MAVVRRPLSVGYCLNKMADRICQMEDAQQRYADLQHAPIDADWLTNLRVAQGDCAYYAGQAQTYALAANTLMHAAERYPGLLHRPHRPAAELDDDDLRGAHPAITKQYDGFAIPSQRRAA